MAPPAKSKAQLQKTFRLNGFSLRHEAALHLEALLAPIDDFEKVEEWNNRIVDALRSKTLESSAVGKDLLTSVIKVKRSASGLETAFSAFFAPRAFCFIIGGLERGGKSHVVRGGRKSRPRRPACRQPGPNLWRLLRPSARRRHAAGSSSCCCFCLQPRLLAFSFFWPPFQSTLRAFFPRPVS